MPTGPKWYASCPIAVAFFKSWFDAELLTQACFVFRARFVLACGACLLMLFATFGIGSSAAIHCRHFLFDALTEGGSGLIFARSIGLLPGFALLRAGSQAAIEVFALTLHALFAFRAGFVLACFAGFVDGIPMRIAGFRIDSLAAVTGSLSA